MVETSGPTFNVDDPATFGFYDSTVYYSVGFDGIKNSADYCVNSVGDDRWNALKIPLQPWRKRQAGHVLIIGQTDHGPSSQHIDIYDWYRQAARDIRKCLDCPIRFRQHPRITSIRTRARKKFNDRTKIHNSIGQLSRFSYSDRLLLSQDLHGCRAVVVFTSNAAVAAAVAGVPVFACDPGCMAWDVANRSLAAIKTPVFPDRTTWANRVAYSQWNSAELRSGACWTHLRSHADKARKP